MFKNFIIIFLFFLLCSLMIQKPDNAKLLISDLAASKNMVVDGTEYIQKTFSQEFSVVDETIESIEEPIKKMTTGIDDSNWIPTKSPNLTYMNEEKIIEDTWFNEG